LNLNFVFFAILKSKADKRYTWLWLSVYLILFLIYWITVYTFTRFLKSIIFKKGFCEKDWHSI
jgi:hypothetical protein